MNREWFPLRQCDFADCPYRYCTRHWHCTHDGCDHIFLPRLVHEPGCDGYPTTNGYESDPCCTGTDDYLYHVHCNIDGCIRTTFHEHCKQRANCTTTVYHIHCSDSGCDWVACGNGELGHCHHGDGKCQVTLDHVHSCNLEGCSVYPEHKHCDICQQICFEVHGYANHQHCATEGCTLTIPHRHCEECNFLVHHYVQHSKCLVCNECITNSSHRHCDVCDIRVNSDTYHQHCNITGCNNTSCHRHCRFLCVDTEQHSHCSKCKSRKEKGKKHVCIKII